MIYLFGAYIATSLILICFIVWQMSQASSRAMTLALEVQRQGTADRQQLENKLVALFSTDAAMAAASMTEIIQASQPVPAGVSRPSGPNLTAVTYVDEEPQYRSGDES